MVQNTTSSDIYSGDEDFFIHLSVKDCFITISLTNQTYFPLSQISPALLTKTNVKFLRNIEPFDIDPVKSRKIIIPYTSKEEDNLTVCVMFTREEEHFMIRDLIVLPAQSEENLKEFSIWDDLKKQLKRTEIYLQSKISPMSIVESLNHHFKWDLTGFNGINNSDKDTILTVYDAKNIIMVELKESQFTIFGDRQFNRDTIKNAVYSKDKIQRYFELGELFITAKNFIDIEWESKDFLIILSKIESILADANIQNNLKAFKQGIAKVKNLAQLPSIERNNLLLELERLERIFAPI